MITSASDIPFDGYWKTAGQVFTYPMVTVFARTAAEADEIAGPEHRVATYDNIAAVHLALDSAEAQHRLGVFGDVAAQDAMMRGDSPTSTN